MSELPLEEQAFKFADELTSVLQGALPGAPGASAEVSDASGRVIVKPDSPVKLFVNGVPLATLDVRLRCELDSRGTWLAIESSSFTLSASVDRTPVIRFDFLRSPRTCPSAHIQVHAHRGALTHLLSQSGHDRPHDMSALHIPVGGSRLRPCLEDVVQFLVEECHFDKMNEYRAALESGRARWRRIQAKAIVRDFPAEAVETLESLGFTIVPPSAGVSTTPEKVLHTW